MSKLQRQNGRNNDSEICEVPVLQNTENFHPYTQGQVEGDPQE